VGDLAVVFNICAACPINSYCQGLSQTTCPSNTHSPAQSSLQSQCRCNAGYKCRYGRDVQLFLRFTLDSATFTAQQSTIRSQIATAAGVLVAGVGLQSSSNVARRLLEVTLQGSNVTSLEVL
jgi:hypothetical protein